MVGTGALAPHLILAHATVRPIKEGDPVYKFGQVIGFASKPVALGEHVHVHNVKAEAFARDYAFGADLPAPLPPPAEHLSFMGYDRGPGKPAHQRGEATNEFMGSMCFHFDLELVF